MKKITLPLIAFFVCLVSTFAIAEGFNYNVPVGADWCGLAAENAPCCEGKEQSPINIATAAAKYDMHLPRLDFDYPRKCTLELVNNGHTIQANVPAGVAKLKIGDKEYELVQFHFHVPSEHTMDGKQYPMEMHLVHKSAEGELAVVGVFIDDTLPTCVTIPTPLDYLKWALSRGNAVNNERSRLWEAFPAVAGATSVVEDFRIKVLLPQSKKSFRYAGSLTTPPCTEGVAWDVMTKPISVSSTNVSRLRTCLFGADEFLHPEGNARPVQPLQGRDVATDVKP